ncbi:MAG: hypothetical protein LBQ88_05260 [Treponema sp.]|nr:hypothetical protein [Treponema sp.]
MLGLKETFGGSGRGADSPGAKASVLYNVVKNIKWETAKSRGKNAASDAAFPEILILDGNDLPLFEGALNDIRFTEELVIAKSILFFQDGEPCFIHRSAVAARLYAELLQVFSSEPCRKISINQLDEKCPGYLDRYPGAECIQLKNAHGPLSKHG